ERQRLGVATELDADFLEDRVGVVLDEGQALLAQDLEGRELAGQVGDVLGMGGKAERLSGGPATASTPLRVVHQASSLVPIATVRLRRRSARASAPAAPVVAVLAGRGTTAPRCGNA